MFIAAWIHFLCTLIYATLAYHETEKITFLKISEHIAGQYESELWLARSSGRKSSLVPKLGQKVGYKDQS